MINALHCEICNHGDGSHAEGCEPFKEQMEVKDRALTIIRRLMKQNSCRAKQIGFGNCHCSRCDAELFLNENG